MSKMNGKWDNIFSKLSVMRLKKPKSQNTIADACFCNFNSVLKLISQIAFPKGRGTHVNPKPNSSLETETLNFIKQPQKY